jgi:hypothetical protein
MYFVVSFEGRCMGFCPLESKAQDLVVLFGEGAMYEKAEGAFPTHEESAARAYEADLRARNPVVALRSIAAEQTTIELTADELEELKQATEVDTLDEDPWADREDTMVSYVGAAPGESGFFLPNVQAG